MKKLAIWLKKHGFCIGDSVEANVVLLWSILVSFSFITVFCLLGWTGTVFAWVCGALFLGATIVPPIVAAIISVVKKQAWNPWYWFPIVIGFVIGGFLAILVCLICGRVKLW